MNSDVGAPLFLKIVFLNVASLLKDWPNPSVTLPGYLTPRSGNR